MGFFSKRSISVLSDSVFLFHILSCFISIAAMSGDLPAKKAYTPELDTLWTRNIYIHQMSNDGLWIACSELFDKKSADIILLNTRDSLSFRMDGGDFFAFSNDNNWFGYISRDKDMVLFSLKDHTRQVWRGISSYQFNFAGDHFTAIRTNQGSDKSLLIVDLKDSTAVEMKDVCEYKWHPEKSIIAASLRDSSGSKVILYNVLSQRQNILCGNERNEYSGLLWSESGNALVFVEKTGEKLRLNCYSPDESIQTSVNVKTEGSFPDSILDIRDFSVSKDGTTVLYSLGFLYGTQKTESPEIWNTSEPWIYPRVKVYNESERLVQFTAWDVRSGVQYQVTDDNTPTAEYCPDSPNILIYNMMAYEPQYKQDTDVDLYIKNFRTGEKQLIVRKQYTYRGFIKLSPSGRYVAYFHGNAWWVYDSENKRTVNLTGSMDSHFEKIDDSPKVDKEPYGNPGWSEDEKYIILYDRYDIWLMTPDGNSRERITQGKEQKIAYRMSRELKRNEPDYYKSLHVYTGIVFNLNEVLMLEMQGDDHNTGYAVWKNKNTVETLSYGTGKADGILISKDQNLIVFRRYRFNEPPAIFALNLVNKEAKMLYQSNQRLLNYDLGKSELIKSGTGKKGCLSGELIYPAQFDPEKKYPMIVWIYEKNSKMVNYFTPPSDYEYDGFNILRYVTNGYFVLLPDIEYSTGNPGISALKSVTGLVSKVLQYEYIDKSRIGLNGHSFGGYEAAFIATQTDMFRTIVAGSPVTDLVSWYHDIQWLGWDTEQMWRMENHQFRMGGSFYDMKRKYYRNSPLHQIEKLNTPLLLWAGKNDYNVNWYQSIYMFMAMKRSNKEGRLLMFNDEGHSMMSPPNKVKLSQELFNWFNHYLKEERSE